MRASHDVVDDVQYFLDLDLSKMSPEQQLVTDMVTRYYQRICSAVMLLPPPLLLCVMGTAGTGKSYCIRRTIKMLAPTAAAIKELLAESGPVALTAPTGIAASNIRGVTLQSMLKVRDAEIGDKQVRALEAACRHLKILIVDEVSMVGRRMLGRLDRNLRLGIDARHLRFGGVAVVIIGDHAQLPPVKDKPLYVREDAVGGAVEAQGCAAYLQFEDVVVLSRPFRQGAADDFYNMLLRIREGDVDGDVWRYCRDRCLTNLPCAERAEFEDALYLGATRDQVWEINHNKRLASGQPIAVMKAVHDHPVAEKIPAEDMFGLSPVVCLAKGSRIMLINNLWARMGPANGGNGLQRGFE